MPSEDDCIQALLEAAEELGESPTKIQYEALQKRPASGTIMRALGGWNAAKEAAGLEVFEQGSAGGTGVDPKPEWVTVPDGQEWAELSGHQRWYLKNREYSRTRKDRRRKMLKWWLYQFKKDNSACVRCGESHPACLDFHHPEGVEKEFSVSKRVNRGHSIDNIRSEMARCVVLCSNCHRREHFDEPEKPERTLETD